MNSESFHVKSEEDNRVQRLKHCEYNNQDEENSPKYVNKTFLCLKGIYQEENSGFWFIEN